MKWLNDVFSDNKHILKLSTILKLTVVQKRRYRTVFLHYVGRVCSEGTNRIGVNAFLFTFSHYRSLTKYKWQQFHINVNLILFKQPTIAGICVHKLPFPNRFSLNLNKRVENAFSIKPKNVFASYAENKHPLFLKSYGKVLQLVF